MYMVILSISEWIANLFIFSISLCLISVGVLILATIASISTEWIKRKVEESKK